MDLKYKNKLEVLNNFLCGIFIGISIIVPGLNGSIIAMVMNSYNKIIYSLSNLNKCFKKSIFFLFPIGLGLIIGVIISILLLQFIINKYPIYLFSLFIGLMIGSYPMIFSKIKYKYFIKKSYLLIIGFIVPVLLILISYNSKINIEYSNLNINEYIHFFIIGIILSITQLIPGISATIILMIFGCYIYLLNGINVNLINNNEMILLYIVIIIGFLLGVIMFSKFINYFIINRQEDFNYLICGLFVSSIVCMFLNKEMINILKLIIEENYIKTIIFSFFNFFLGFFITFMIYLLKVKRCKNE